MKERIAKAFAAVHERQPLVQCITNFVTVNDCANIILAAGGSVTMSMDVREVEEAVERADALVCNMGAIGSLPSMLLAGRRANRLGIPVLLDPVAAGGTALRREAVRELGDSIRFAAIRGNASEMAYLSGCGSSGSGVDVAREDMIDGRNLDAAAERLRSLGERLSTVAVISGATDILSDGKETVLIKNGCATMSRITGSGCMLTALMGAFCAALPSDSFAAACAAVALMGLAGEEAERKRLEKGSGSATFRTDLIDAVFNMTEKKLLEAIRYEIYS